MGSFLMLVGAGFILTGFTKLLIEAFSESLLWGLGCLMIAPISMVFIYLHWDTCKWPVFYQVLGGGLLVLTVLFR